MPNTITPNTVSPEMLVEDMDSGQIFTNANLWTGEPTHLMRMSTNGSRYLAVSLDDGILYEKQHWEGLKGIPVASVTITKNN